MDNENSDIMDCSTPRRHLSLHVAVEPFRRSLCCYGMKRWHSDILNFQRLESIKVMAYAAVPTGDARGAWVRVYDK